MIPDRLPAHDLIEAHSAVVADGIGPDDPAYPEALTRLLEGKHVGSYKGDTRGKAVLAAGAQLLGHERFLYRRRKDTAFFRSRMESILKDHQRRLNSLVRMFQEGSITEAALTRRSKELLQNAYKTSYRHGLYSSGYQSAMAHSGELMSQHDRQFVQSAFKEEMTHWNKALRKIVDGTETNPARRIDNYLKSAESMYHAARVVSLPDNMLIHWLVEDRNACPDCQWLWKQSPFSRDTLPVQPRSGRTICLHNCRCELAFRRATPAQIEAVRRKHRSATALYNRFRKNKRRG